MHGQLLAYISVIATSGVLNLYLFVYIFRKRHLYKTISSYFLPYIGTIVIYCLGAAFGMLSTNLAELKFWTIFMYFGLPYASPLGLLFIMRYLGFKIKKKQIVGLLIIPVLTTVLVATNDLHHLYYRVFEIHPTLGAPFFYQEIGFWYLLQGILTFACMLTGFLLLASRYREMSKQYRPQILALVFGQFLPMTTAFVYLIGLTPEGIDPVPMVMWISTVLYFWAINSSRLFSLMPVAKDVIFNSINDAVMVLDESLRLVEINQACRRHFTQVNRSLIGSDIQEIWEVLFDVSFDMKIGMAEIKTQLNEERVYQVRLSLLDNSHNIDGFLIMFTDITEVKKLQSLLEQQAYYDDLTQIYNRRAFLKQCELEYEQSVLEQTPFSVMIMDVDYFKKVNDVYGHHMGDRLLEHVVRICQSYLVNEELFARYGGEEFVFAIKNCPQVQAERLANRIRVAVERTPLITSEGELSVTLSLGVVESIKEIGETVSDLLNKADKALYQAKETGRNKVNVYIND
ncbi:diguanylate cyclase [Marinilactibacillus sp. GCM10026970]|uniref:histidine kinase N-terminal 7TM domain-containing diguanylate cyclase n=1 Tax=Marinilactibacillus sp. GCM10026970 TaxID=3252642 RepID=UPI00362451F3